MRTVAALRVKTPPPVRLVRVTVRVSVPSTKPSFVVGMLMVLEVSPAANVTVPVVRVKSVPSVAVPLDVA